jgi:hypothetical protein
MNCCPSNFLSGSTAPPPPSLVNKYTVNSIWVHIQCVSGEEVWGSGPQTDEHLPQSPFIGQYIIWRNFVSPSTSVIFLRYYSTVHSNATFRMDIIDRVHSPQVYSYVNWWAQYTNLTSNLKKYLIISCNYLHILCWNKCTLWRDCKEMCMNQFVL